MVCDIYITNQFNEIRKQILHSYDIDIIYLITKFSMSVVLYAAIIVL